MRLEDYLTKVLYDPTDGYYTQSTVVGKTGDFITAPEISPLFSLCIAQWIVDQWHNAGSPTPINLVELGAGKGTMLATILKSMEQIPHLANGLKTYILETSDHLKAIQHKILQPYAVHWISRLNEVSKGYTIILANEFFDALPIQYYRSDNTTTSELNINDNQLVWNTIDSNTFNEGITYTSRLYEQFIQDISSLLNGNSGVGLIIDYGSLNPGFTLQAVKNHNKVGLFDFIGQADITHHVDFSYLNRLFDCHSIKTLGPISQGQFLKELEIENLVHSLNSLPNYRDQLLAVHRLTAPQEMGDLFKVLAIQGGPHAEKSQI